MKIDNKIILEFTMREAQMLEGFLCEFEGEEYGGVNISQKIKSEFINNLLYAIVMELKKHE